MKSAILIYLITIFSTGTALNAFAQDNALLVEKAGSAALYKNPEADVEARINDLMSRMTIEDKALLLHPNFFSTKSNQRLGIPQLKFIDGSYGVRSGQSTSFCAAVNYGATWNPELIKSVGVALADEIKAKDRNMLLGPVIIMHRIPQNGRNAESYSEDPYLAGTIVSSYIKGIQSRKIAATAAFPGAKTQEYHTHNYDARVDERTLNEIYYPAFRMAVEDGKVWGIMTPYHRINGIRAANNTEMLRYMIKGKWKFPGLIMTDWAGVKNFEESVYAGLDLDMPDGRQYTVEKLMSVYKYDKILTGRLDESVKRFLRVLFANGIFEAEPVKAQFDTVAHRGLSLQVARESITLLKNEGDILPLDRMKIRSLAVIGPNADVCRHSIISASRVLPYKTVTPLEGIITKAGREIKINYSQGCYINDEGRFLRDDQVRTPDGREGYFVEFFDNKEMKGEPVFTRTESAIAYNFLTNAAHPEKEEGEYSLRATGLWTPVKSGYYHILTTGGTVSVINSDSEKMKNSEELPVTKLIDNQQYQYFSRGKTYKIKAEYKHQKWNDFELRYKYYEDDALNHAVEAARHSDAAVLFLGFSETLECEEQDRSPDLPENQIELLKAVRAVNPNIIVILNTGSGVSIEPWGKEASGIIEAYYPGQEGGTAVADILFGDINPSGKLPFTCMKQWRDSPVYGYYPNGPDEMVHFVEGIYVGYRWFDRPDTPDAAFAFGHGLSYTTFGYSDLKITPDSTSTGNITATVHIQNTGKMAGAEVAQLYIGDDHCSVDRPVKELKGFNRVFLEPGEIKTVTFTIHPDDLKFYDVVRHDWKAEPGSFTLYVGSSSRDIRQTGKFILSFPKD